MRVSFPPGAAALVLLVLPLPAGAAESSVPAQPVEALSLRPGDLAYRLPGRSTSALLQVSLDVSPQCTIVFSGNSGPDATVRIDCSRSVPWLANFLPPDEPGDLRFEAVPFSPGPLPEMGRMLKLDDESRRVRLGLDF